MPSPGNAKTGKLMKHAKKIESYSLLAGIYSLSLFFLTRFALLYLGNLDRGISPEWRERIGDLWWVNPSLLIIASVAWVIAISLRFQSYPFFLVFFWTLFPLLPLFLYGLPLAATYDAPGNALYIEHYFAYELAAGIVLFIAGIILQFKHRSLTPPRAKSDAAYRGRGV